ncbi:NAD(P)H-binding protein [Luteimonas sp BLCC-B24]|uniref:NAD-dependent epimerase/dehydratase family protein n=1 Tax=Luteimonas sp. BLCC-B24 TaxID=3025317 RepID=UPI00234C9C29|nr:NAD-dependent epimerase/dehydratase family protein [Luteimonas sp. BLCC-B24]MDC7806741.1 NAD(P)H-binding protein [Luteimonas sp. BLCC-B24]
MTANTVLVLGATGGIGRPVAERLLERGWSVRALHRSPGSVKGLAGIEWVQGDAMSRADVTRAAEGMSAIVHAVKPREYTGWHSGVLPMIDNTLAAARGARVVVPGNVYNYGPDAGVLIREDAPQNPTTAKGALRVAMERRIGEAVAQGQAKALIVRAGDFFGPGAGSSWLSEAMIKPGQRPRTVRNPSTRGVGHQWVYLPDLAETIVELMARDDLPAFARYHMDGHWDADGAQMAAAIVRALGPPPVGVRPLPWWLISALAPVMPSMRELAELKHLWRSPVRLSNERLIATLGHEPHTDLDTAIRQTLAHLEIPVA